MVSKAKYLAHIGGFTIVELLIVIIIIGILAALVVTMVAGMQNRAYDASVQNDLGLMRKKIEAKFLLDTGTYRSDMLNSGVFLRINKAAYATEPDTTYNFVYCNSPPDYDRYWVYARSKSGKVFTFSDTTGITEYGGTWYPGEGQDDLCRDMGAPAPGTSNYRGYAAEDTIGGPWRLWVGGN